jgi:hypothetical protein
MSLSSKVRSLRTPFLQAKSIAFKRNHYNGLVQPSSVSSRFFSTPVDPEYMLKTR